MLRIAQGPPGSITLRGRTPDARPPRGTPRSGRPADCAGRRLARLPDRRLPRSPLNLDLGPGVRRPRQSACAAPQGHRSPAAAERADPLGLRVRGDRPVIGDMAWTPIRSSPFSMRGQQTIAMTPSSRSAEPRAPCRWWSPPGPSRPSRARPSDPNDGATIAAPDRFTLEERLRHLSPGRRGTL